METRGIRLKTQKNKRELILQVEPLLLDSPINAKAITKAVSASPFNKYFLVDKAISDACNDISMQLAQNNMEGLQYLIGVAKDAEVEVSITQENMCAELIITAAYAGLTPNVSKLKDILKSKGVVRGIGDKSIRQLLRIVLDSGPGMVRGRIVAKGLPPKNGKDSKVQPIVPNVLDRILAPKQEDEKIDMRDFGEIICVEKNAIVARRLAPSLGRSGFTVTGEVISSTSGEWKKIELGNNVIISPKDENIVLAKLTGLPKFANGKVSVDDVLVTRGVNVATGNITYAGAVIVNGDVTEKMRIQCDGDITVNGFVESAYIEAGGDIIITQGATGRIQDEDCQLIAKGNIYLAHGQGLHIKSGYNVNAAKQLAYSKITCHGDLVVGHVTNPQGKLFASSVESHGTVTAGHIGAVSGSELLIDFTVGFETLQKKLESMLALFKDLLAKNADHEIKISSINNRKDSDKQIALREKLNQELELERVFVNWLRINIEEVRSQLTQYENNIKVVAKRSLYNGVIVKLGKATLKVEKEYTHAKLLYEEASWLCQSI